LECDPLICENIDNGTVYERECEAKIWDLPASLALQSQFSRAKHPDVLMEGWLYWATPEELQHSTIMESQTIWSRHWFILHYGSISVLGGNHYHDESKTNNLKVDDRAVDSFSKVKICDISSCTTVRILSSNDNKSLSSP